MTKEEAFIVMKSMGDSIDRNNGGIACLDSKVGKALQMGAEAMQKQIPQKPHHTKIQYEGGHTWITNECPYCFEYLWEEYGIWDRLIDKGTPYCRRCGQAIDWED